MWVEVQLSKLNPIPKLPDLTVCSGVSGWNWQHDLGQGHTIGCSELFPGRYMYTIRSTNIPHIFMTGCVFPGPYSLHSLTWKSTQYPDRWCMVLAVDALYHTLLGLEIYFIACNVGYGIVYLHTLQSLPDWKIY